MVVESALKRKTILITGGSGSFGQKFCEIVLKEHDPKEIRVYSRGELLQVEMSRYYNDKRLVFIIGDVRDKDRLTEAMRGVDIVVHAAAMKQIPVCEDNPVEAIKTNILGSVNLVEAAITNKVDKVIAISSDKACQPLNLYGMTKACMEKVIIHANGETRFGCVRYGNVAHSRGSVFPLFLKQRKTGKITITDERMTRFHITLEQGVHFVIESLGRMGGGEIFIPKLPSVRITDLADVIAPDAEREIIGIRSGEKLHEVLISEGEASNTTACMGWENKEEYLLTQGYLWGQTCFDNKGWSAGIDHFVISNGCGNVHLRFRYSSDTNTEWLTKEEIREML